MKKVFYFARVTLEGLEWNTIEDIVIKWNQVFRDFCEEEESQKYKVYYNPV